MTEKMGPPQPAIHKNSISKRNSFLVVLYLYGWGWVFDVWVGGGLLWTFNRVVIRGNGSGQLVVVSDGLLCLPAEWSSGDVCWAIGVLPLWGCFVGSN